jgi:cellulose biosynthesis protein BcsQ
VTNIKGCIGKTKTAVNLAYLAAAAGSPPVLWDLDPQGEACELLVMDCPPGISLLSENVLRAADAVVVPVIPSPLSLRMVEQLQQFIAEAGWRDLQILPLFSLVDHRKPLHAIVRVRPDRQPVAAGSARRRT